jgi:hypothetical protein
LGDTWNGFECPFFTKKVAEEILQETIDTDLTQEYFVGFEYDEENDQFILEETDDKLFFPARKFQTVEGDKIPLYAIGACMWCWSKSKKGIKDPNIIEIQISN